MTVTRPAIIGERRSYTRDRLEQFLGALRRALSEADEAFAFGEHACLYVTGSGGRGELHPASDVDVFIAYEDVDHPKLRAMLIQAAVVRATRECGFPLPSRDGAFLAPHATKDFIELLGSPADDMENKLTARMLLLLESSPLIGHRVYERVVEQVVGRYWETSRGHEDEFLPYMLANDIIRYWRIVLLNHEARLSEKRKALENRGGDAAEIDRTVRHTRKYSSYKMRFARCLTCFSALVHMLGLTRDRGSLTRQDALAMIEMPPVDRLVYVAKEYPVCAGSVHKLLEQYATFLKNSEAGEEAIVARLRSEPGFAKELSDQSAEFTATLFDLMLELRSEKNERLFRHMVI